VNIFVYIFIYTFEKCMFSCSKIMLGFASSTQMSQVAALVRSDMNDLIPFQRTIKQTTETISLASKQYNSCYTMTTNRITSLQGLQHFCHKLALKSVQFQRHYNLSIQPFVPFCFSRWRIKKKSYAKDFNHFSRSHSRTPTQV